MAYIEDVQTAHEKHDKLSTQKIGKDTERHFTIKDAQMANKQKNMVQKHSY